MQDELQELWLKIISPAETKEEFKERILSFVEYKWKRDYDLTAANDLTLRFHKVAQRKTGAGAMELAAELVLEGKLATCPTKTMKTIYLPKEIFDQLNETEVPYETKLAAGYPSHIQTNLEAQLWNYENRKKLERGS